MVFGKLAIVKSQNFKHALSANIDMRLDKNVKIDIYNLQDKKETKSLRFNNSWKKIRYLKIGL